ncbi:hypothetical protein BGX23_000481 [Mortierella sp. AD031]|nr:hypothetical protein BGX23_000481 [Mortierella sp. AD031]
MNNSFSSFQQDLALEQDSRRFGDEEHITRAHLRPKKPAETEGGLKTLGMAIMVICQAKRSALRKAMANLEAESSLRSLIRHVETANTDDQGEQSIVRMREVYRSFLDKIIKKSDPDKETAFLVLEWLILKFPYRTLMVRALGDDLSPSNDKKRKLAVLLAIEDAIDSQSRSALVSKKESVSKSKSKSKLTHEETIIPAAESGRDAEKSVEALADGETLSAWMASLSAIVQNDGRTPDGGRSMTRLTSLAIDIAIEISRTLADQTLQEIKSAEAQERTQKPALVVEVGSEDEDRQKENNAENTQPFGLGFVKSMKSTHTIIKYFLLSNRSLLDVASAGMTDILDMLVRFNRHYGGGRGLPSREIMFSFAQSWKLISTVLVKRRASLSNEEILNQAQTYSQMILENIPVGQATAIAVQTYLIPTLSEAEVKDIKGKIVAILDTPSEISVGSANVSASYMTVFPEMFVPELLTHLRRQRGSVSNDKAVVRKIMNSLHVVEAMAEKNFFAMVLSPQAGDLRHALEDLVIDLFREDDISVRVTLGQIAASLSDGFAVFLEYIR